MIHVVTIHNQHLYARQLDEMFRMRHEFYIQQRGWTNLSGEDGRETDEFDNEHAVYLLNLDRFGHILATFRINPTTTPYLLADKLPEYLAGPAPRDEAIWDLTRWMVAPNARRESAADIAHAQKALICGVMEFAQSRGITHYTTLTDTVFLERIKRVWPVTHLGEPRHFEDGNGDAVAIMIEAGPHVLVSSRNTTAIYEPVLFELNPNDPENDEENGMRDAAISSYEPLNRNNLKQLQTAADMLNTSLKSPSNEPDAQVKAIEAFTRKVRELVPEDA